MAKVDQIHAEVRRRDKDAGLWGVSGAQWGASGEESAEALALAQADATDALSLQSRAASLGC